MYNVLQVIKWYRVYNYTVEIIEDDILGLLSLDKSLLAPTLQTVDLDRVLSQRPVSGQKEPFQGKVCINESGPISWSPYA